LCAPWYLDPRDLRSFPTRRSSDLGQLERVARGAADVGTRVMLLQVPVEARVHVGAVQREPRGQISRSAQHIHRAVVFLEVAGLRDRKSTRLNSSHVKISYAVFCLK